MAGLIYRLKVVALRSRNAVLSERNRLAREIHDTLAQGLIGIKVQIEVAKELLAKAPTQAQAQAQAQPYLERAQALADACVDEARHSVSALRETTDEETDLGAAIKRMAQTLTMHHELQLKLVNEGVPVRLSGEAFHNLLRLLREALTNVLRHAHAHQVTVLLRQDAHQVSASVSDDGVGFDIQHSGGSHFGIAGMRERAQHIGATFSIRSTPGVGTSVEIQLPLPAHGHPR